MTNLILYNNRDKCCDYILISVLSYCYYSRVINMLYFENHLMGITDGDYIISSHICLYNCNNSITISSY